MAKRSGGAQAEAARRAARRAVKVAPEVALAGVRDRLVRLDAERAELLEARGDLVDELRASGVPWSRVVVLAGCSRPALLKQGTSGRGATVGASW